MYYQVLHNLNFTKAQSTDQQVSIKMIKRQLKIRLLSTKMYIVHKKKIGSFQRTLKYNKRRRAINTYNLKTNKQIYKII